MNKDETLKLALETLEYAGPSWIDARQPAITAIKEALAQRTWVWLTDEDEIDWEDGGNLKDLVKAIENKLKDKNT